MKFENALLLSEEESDPVLVANHINKIIKNNGQFFLNNIDTLLNQELSIRNNKNTLPIGKNKNINLTDSKSVNNYIDTIISLVNKEDNIKYQQVLKKLENFRHHLLHLQ